MKGKHHLLSGVVFLFILFFIDLFFGFRVHAFFSSLNLLVSFFVLYLFFMGLLLPDADKFSSWIFKFFFPFAIGSWFIGLVISFLKGKKFRHRGFLHSFFGIFLTSLFSSFVVFFGLSFFINLDIFVLLIFVFSVLLGQVLHLVLD